MSESTTTLYSVGQTVVLNQTPPYLKTADPMPMLRPADLITGAEPGVILERRPGNCWAVKFARGVFLLDEQYLAIAPDPDSEASTAPSEVEG
ncbi:DUF3148 domain-containing protein [Spirulina major CS-329]|uniref:regulatory protein SipA n=1 Tax=Spirulina TaxID=1154 RepID=UPI00232EFC6D|nr:MULTISPECIES: DUF3148 domain-containing protein [Spirulina]MDB9494284.1 DUF3148 domain-containing protein [Spirulina subsalsa CS-330]MDB9503168.1 DUF3148 domain-containing protein [Spirulina major CS-329]